MKYFLLLILAIALGLMAVSAYNCYLWITFSDITARRIGIANMMLGNVYAIIGMVASWYHAKKQQGYENSNH